MTNDIFVERLSALVEEKIEFERDKAAKLSAEGLKKTGKKRSFNRKSIAEELNIDYTTFLSYLKTEMSDEKKTDKIPNGKTLATLAEYFDVSIDYLLGLSDTKTKDIKIAAIGDYTGLSREAIDFLHIGQVLRHEDVEVEWGIYSFEYVMKVINRLLSDTSLLRKMENVVRTTHEVNLSLEKVYEDKVYEILGRGKNGDMDENGRMIIDIQLGDLVDRILLALFEVTREIEYFFDDGFHTNDTIKKIESMRTMLYQDI